MILLLFFYSQCFQRVLALNDSTFLDQNFAYGNVKRLSAGDISCLAATLLSRSDIFWFLDDLSGKLAEVR
jgi:hypothetical protein